MCWGEFGWSHCWATESSSFSLPPTNLCYSHIHTPLQSPANHYLSSFLLPLPASLCMCCHGDHGCSPHTLSLSLLQYRWSRLVGADAGRLQTSSLPSGRRPIFTNGHRVYEDQHIYRTAANPTLPKKHFSPHSASLSQFISQKCYSNHFVLYNPWNETTALFWFGIILF